LKFEMSGINAHLPFLPGRTCRPGVCALSLLAATVVLHTSNLLAEESDSASQATPDSFFALPVELEGDSGAANGDATLLRISPLYGSPSTNNWKVIHLSMLTIADAPGGVPGQPGNPDPVPGGGHVFGIGDLTHASFFTPPSSGKAIWGFGAMLGIPIASDRRLGSGKWSAGPAFRFVYRSGPWNFGVFGGQLWSFAGSSNRGDVSQLLMRGAIRRELPNDWFFVSAPVITANWRAEGQKWKLPLGGGVGKVFRYHSNPWALSLQGYYNVVKPDGAPNWSVRLAVIAPLQFGNK
jgi:hypothetical protein